MPYHEQYPPQYIQPTQQYRQYPPQNQQPQLYLPQYQTGIVVSSPPLNKNWDMDFFGCLRSSNCHEAICCHYFMINEQIASICCEKKSGCPSISLTVGIFLLDILTTSCICSYCTTLFLRNKIISKYNIDSCYCNLCACLCCTCALWQQQYELFNQGDLPILSVMPQIS